MKHTRVILGVALVALIGLRFWTGTAKLVIPGTCPSERLRSLRMASSVGRSLFGFN